MREQMGDVVVDVDKPAVITLWRHTRRSRAVWLVVLVLLLTTIVLHEVTRADEGLPWYFSGIVIAVVLVQRFSRRWQVKTLRPAPQAADDKSAYKRLEYVQLALMVIGCGPLMWMMFDAVDSAWHPLLRGFAAVSFLAFIIGQRFVARAHEQLFERIASRDGAYGF